MIKKLLITKWARRLKTQPAPESARERDMADEKFITFSITATGITAVVEHLILAQQHADPEAPGAMLARSMAQHWIQALLSAGAPVPQHFLGQLKGVFQNPQVFVGYQ